MRVPTLRDLIVWIAGGALLVAMAVDSLAMLGRQVRIPLLGSIEIVEAAVLVASAGALVIAALDTAHARVTLVFDRLPPRWRARFSRLHALAAALVHAGLLAGTLWIAADLWSGYEESELLHIPYRPLRAIVAIAFAVLFLLALKRLWRREPR
jgi:TRAP-type C4-dicarboxylate transport system permease small subunit